MSVTTLPLIPLNQTSDFIETSTDCDNLTYGNYSDQGKQLKGNDESFLELWTDFDTYKYIFWGTVFCITAMGTIGNVLVFIMMGDKKLSFLSYSVYLKFLAVSDSCLLITTLLSEGEKIYALGQFVEVIKTLCILPFSLRIVSLWLVVGLSLDRYVCVCFPLNREILCTRMKAIAICSSVVGISVVLSVPFYFQIELVRGQCFPSEKVKYYYMFFRVLFSSALPCLIILVLNIFIIIQIQRSLNFRNTFIRSIANTASRQQDSSTRPLVLVSVLAFVTMIPGALIQVVISAVRLLNIDFKDLALLGNIWSICSTIYLLNFGQNFYILIASSSNYRQIIRKRLCCFSLKCNQEHKMDPVMLTNIPSKSKGPKVESTDIPGSSTGSQSGTTGLSLTSIIFDDTNELTSASPS